MTITISERPVMGKVSRVCRVCGEPYEGWNFVQCQECENSCTPVTVIETWR